jgi:hypothetical protein
MRGPAVDFPFIGYLPCRLDQQTQTHGLLHHALYVARMENLAPGLGLPGQKTFHVQTLVHGCCEARCNDASSQEVPEMTVWLCCL